MGYLNVFGWLLVLAVLIVGGLLTWLIAWLIEWLITWVANWVNGAAIGPRAERVVRLIALVLAIWFALVIVLTVANAVFVANFSLFTSPITRDMSSRSPALSAPPSAAVVQQQVPPQDRTSPLVPSTVPTDTTTVVTNNTFIALKYDETGGTGLTSGQTRLAALYLRDAMGAGSTQSAMEAAIASIQREAAASHATTFQGATLTLDQHQAWLVGCSDASRVDFPADTSIVFDKMPKGPAQVYIQVPFAQGVPIRTKDTFSGCNAPAGFWAVAVR